MIESIRDGATVKDRVATRKDSIIKEYWLLSVISVILILITTKLVLNFRASDEKTLVRMSTFAKISQILLLPTVVFFVAKVISGIISDSHTDMFVFVGQFMLTNVILVPTLGVVFYGIRLRSQLDLILYILLFAFALIGIEEYYFLKNILI
jgi:hypothetical protein